MNYEECIELARPRIGKYCKACKECNGKACGNQIPGPGAKGMEIRQFATMISGKKSV